MNERERIKALEARVRALEERLAATESTPSWWPAHPLMAPRGATICGKAPPGPAVQYTDGLGNTGYVMSSSCAPAPKTNRDISPLVTTYPPR